MNKLINAAGYYFGAECVAAAQAVVAVAFSAFYSAYAVLRRLRWVKIGA